MSNMSTCNKCGRKYPSAPSGVIYKCQCSGGYMVPDTSEALTAPKETAGQKIECVEIIVGSKRKKEIVSLNELARLIKGGAAIYGITLAEPKDWATELWADLFAVRGMPSAAKSTREGRLDDEDQAAIALIRERVVLKGEG